jgi:hypothetical protein
MKKTIAFIFILLSLALILDSVNFSHALMMFYLAGIVPGTNIAIDAARMLEFFTLIAGFIFARIIMLITRSMNPRSQPSSSVQALSN